MACRADLWQERHERGTDSSLTIAEQKWGTGRELESVIRQVIAAG